MASIRLFLLTSFLLLLSVDGQTSSSEIIQSAPAQMKLGHKIRQSWDEFVKNFNVKNWMKPKKKEAEEGAKSDGEDTKNECEDAHPDCKDHTDLCKHETYSVMMLHICPKICNFCEERKHFPDSGLACTDHTPRCIRKSLRDKCKTDEETQKVCPWTCGICK